MVTNVGEMAVSIAGHDAGHVYMIISQDKDNVYLADGRLRKLSAPKKKNRKHVQPVHKSLDDITNKLIQGKANDADVVYAIRSVLKDQS